MKLHPDYYSQKGLVGLYLVIIVLILSVGIASSVAFTIVAQLKIVRNNIASAQAYYASESGVEDALLRLRTGLTIPVPGSYPTFAVGTAIAEPDISVDIGGARTITVKGDDTNRIRRSEVVYTIDSTGVGFNFGAQVGDGGMEMRPGSEVIGNVFSNATIFAGGGAGADRLITDSVVIARNGSKLNGVNVGDTSCPTCTGDVRVHTCDGGSEIKGTLTYVSGGSPGSCTAATFIDGGPGEIDPEPFPITDAMIADWKSDAAVTVTVGDVLISSDETRGPEKIDGDLTLSNSVVLTLSGTIWVTGTFNPGNLSVVKLESSYGDLSGIFIVDQKVDISNNVSLEGTSSPTSFLLVAGISSSVDEGDPAMDVNNNVDGAILFAPNGLMVINNNVDLVEASAYKLLLKNGVTITYDVGLANSRFSSGPSGGWVVSSWKEIE